MGGPPFAPGDSRGLVVWGDQWGQVYEAWRARTPARWWALVDHDLTIVRSGELVPPVVDDDSWAAEFARELGIEPVDDPE